MKYLPRFQISLIGIICLLISNNVFSQSSSTIQLLVSDGGQQTGKETNQLSEIETLEELPRTNLGKRPFIIIYQKYDKVELPILLGDINGEFPLIIMRNIDVVDKRVKSQPTYSLESTIWNLSFCSNIQVPQLIAVDRAGFIRFNRNLSPQDVNISKELAQVSEILNEPKFNKIQVGMPSPDFIVPDTNGQKLRLSELKGKKNLLLTFFPKCFTGGCATHLSSLRDQWPALQKHDTEVWGVSVDSADGEKGQLAFAKQLGLPFQLIPDTSRNLSLLFGAVNTPNQVAARISVLIDKKGIVRCVDKQIDVQHHGTDVLAKIDELGMSK